MKKAKARALSRRDNERTAEVLRFLAARLEHVYGENTNLDYMHAARELAQKHEEAERHD